ncbi:MAG TPA: NHLP family bacteriocin export ABC transporter peptidase/permease/ATPase subunit [Candidatus Wallbacteria bacterium]|nr:NHLP family bacteriocin export ABC transporter peptidase/permease/ATPase subunit [Candidatus Wallbacteria bacterium]
MQQEAPKKAYKRVKTPTLIQMEAVECGAASLGIILSYYGLFITLEELREKCGISRDGSKALNVLKAARGYNLVAKGFKYEPGELKFVRYPAIIHWNFNHFLVLEGFSGNKVYLNDPAEGPRVVSYEEFNESYTGVVLTFEKGPEFKTGGHKKSMFKAMLKRLPGTRIALSYSILAGLFLVIPGLVIPTFSKVFIDNILIGKTTDWLRPLLIGMAFTGILRAALTALQQHHLAMLEIKLAVTSSAKFFNHLLHLPIEFFAQRFAGDLSARLQSNDQVAQLFSGELATNALNCILIVFYAFLMCQYDILLTAIGIAIALVNILILQAVSRRKVDQNQKLLQIRGKFMGDAVSGLSIIETLKASGAESDFFEKIGGLHANVVCASQEMDVTNQFIACIPTFLSALNSALILGVGGLLVMNGKMTLGMLVAFQSLMSSFIEPVNRLVQLGSSLQELEGSMNRIDDVMNYHEDKRFEVKPVVEENISKLAGFVELKNVTFGYSKLEPPLIENFNLKLKPGMRVALVGSSGSGKSTIAKLVSGLYAPWSGEILFDGRPRSEISNQIITNSVSIVDQEISMFEGTIKENIILWDSSIPDTSIFKATMDSAIHEDIARRPSAYDAKIEEGGKNFSGGQRQRLEIARALAINPTIMILDEATSALDPQTENLIDESIRRRGCTCIIVAHRLSTVRDCDEIIVMQYGNIVCRGTHDELAADPDSAYSELIKMH